jgi:hypothetical protein
MRSMLVPEFYLLDYYAKLRGNCHSFFLSTVAGNSCSNDNAYVVTVRYLVFFVSHIPISRCPTPVTYCSPVSIWPLTALFPQNFLLYILIGLMQFTIYSSPLSVWVHFSGTVTLGVCVGEGEIPLNSFEKGSERKCVADVCFEYFVCMSLYSKRLVLTVCILAKFDAQRGAGSEVRCGALASPWHFAVLTICWITQ